MQRQTLVLMLMIVAAAGAGACRTRQAPFEMPADASPEVRAAQVAKAESLSRDAQRLELAGKSDRAIDTYRAAIAEYREIPVAWHNLGVLLAKKGRNLEAAEAYKTASELSPTDPRPLYNLGTLWEDLGYLDDAARWYDEALQRDPNYLPALRRSVLVDDLRNRLNQTSAERLKAAILMEREPWWINRFKRIQQRMNEQPGGTGGAGSYAVPESGTSEALPRP
jgi:tetratricopeptide (TPR) repeat protein